MRRITEPVEIRPQPSNIASGKSTCNAIGISVFRVIGCKESKNEKKKHHLRGDRAVT